jgi:hypothetical protein
MMFTLSALLFVPNLPVLLVEPHRNHGGVWRIKFSYETGEPLSMRRNWSRAWLGARAGSGPSLMAQAEIANDFIETKSADLGHQDVARPVPTTHKPPTRRR